MINYDFSLWGEKKAPILGAAKLFRIMKLTSLLLIVFCMHLSAASHSQTVSLDAKNQPLGSVLRTIKKQTNLAVVYNDRLVKPDRKVSIHVEDASLTATLESLLRPLDLTYHITENTIVIATRPHDKAGGATDINLLPETQQRVVTGQVIDKEGAPMLGVNITLKGTSRIILTNEVGRFTITDISAEVVLVVSHLGFKTQEIALGNRPNVLVVMEEDAAHLDEVVVTALGLDRERKSLGYAMSSVSGERLTEALSNNWTEALSGKVAGLNLVKSGAGPAGSNKIILRGETSLSGNNSALIVVDDVVISGSSGQLTGEGYDAYVNQDSPVDFGSSLADLNPEDIESVTVLKGPGAAALYGSRGANGAIIITTKRGKPIEKGIGISVNSNTAIAAINRWPDYQYEYGQGAVDALYFSYGSSEDGPNTGGGVRAWGPKFAGQEYYQYDPNTPDNTPSERTLWVPYRNNRKDFFETALTTTNGISMHGGNHRTSVRLSYTNVNNKWIIPNTGYRRNTVALQMSHELNPKLKVSAKLNYNNRLSDNLPSSGFNNQTIMHFMKAITPNTDIAWFRQRWIPGQEQIAQNTIFAASVDNPYIIAYEMLNTMKRNGIIGNVQAAYQFTDELSLMLRSTIDLQYDARTQRRPKDTYKYPDGMYRERDIFSQETNNDFLVKYDNRKNSALTYSASFGGAYMQNNYQMDEYRAERLLYPGVYNFANSKDLVISVPLRQNYAVGSLYAMGQVGYNNFLFLDLTARQDWASTLASAETNKVTPFFYPSANLSAVLSDVVEFPKPISYLKLRGSVAAVGGGGTTPYLTSYNYNSANTFPSGMMNPVVIPDPNLRFERTVSYELGTDVKLLKNRLGLDLTVYRSHSYDQILQAPIDPASGYGFQVINAGNIRNQGLEIEANADVLKPRKRLRWKVYGTFSANRSKVISLPEDTETIVLGGVLGSRGTVEARLGGMYGDIYGIGYQRSPDGHIIYDVNNGLPLLTDTIMYLGNATPRWRFGFGNEFRYKNIRMNVLFDGHFGGKAYSNTYSTLMREGKLTQSLPGRYNGIIGDGVIRNPDGSFRPNDAVAVSVRDYYFEHYNQTNFEANVLRTDFIKLRELTIGILLGKELTSRLRLQRAEIGVYGRDLFIFTKWPAFDPEFGTLGNGDISKSAEIGQFPSTRTIGLNLKVSL